MIYALQLLLTLAHKSLFQFFILFFVYCQTTELSFKFLYIFFVCLFDRRCQLFALWQICYVRFRIQVIYERLLFLYSIPMMFYCHINVFCKNTYWRLQDVIKSFKMFGFQTYLINRDQGSLLQLQLIIFESPHRSPINNFIDDQVTSYCQICRSHVLFLLLF